MKNKILQLLFLTGFIFFSSCTDLNLYPLSEGSSETWYSDENEITMAVNDLYRDVFWTIDDDAWTDDFAYRDALTPITSGTINGEWITAISQWQNAYVAISRANTILQNIDQSKVKLPQIKLDRFLGEAHFVRACQYAKLISHYGDVVYFTEQLNLEEAFTLSKTDKKDILKKIYDDYDFAIAKLPLSYGSSENKRATKGSALAMKARIALYMGDWITARDAAKACIDLGVYDLYSDFGTLFLSKTQNTKESIFSLPRSVALNSFFADTKFFISRNVGGFSSKFPTWDLFCSFLCSDGLPIDKSPLFNPRDPFKNRDPRCSSTIVEFNSRHLGFMYQPHPDSLKVLNFNTGKIQINNDTRGNQQFASFNGLLWKKGIDEDWSDDYKAANEIFIMRYADVLLMYAEAKTELGEIDQAMLDATINKVRARAYKVAVTDKAKYPAVTSTVQSAVRKAIRIERRMEFAFEGIRYMDLIRWKLAEKVLNKDLYAMLDIADIRTKIVKPGLWFFPAIPKMDDDGVPDFTEMYNAGLIKLLAKRKFDPLKQYLWPIPTKEVLINSNLDQNSGY